MTTDSVSIPTRFERLCRMGSSSKVFISEIYRILVDPTLKTLAKHAWVPNFV